MMKVVVKSKVRLSETVCQLTLYSASSPSLPKWQPGAHIDVNLPNQLCRQYSLCGPLDAPYYQISVLLEPQSRGSSKFIHTELEEGLELEISEPRNHFPLVEGSSPCVFFGAGIGITPLLPMIERCVETQRDYMLYYAVATRENAILSEAQSALPNIHLHCKDENSHQRLDIQRCLAKSPQEAHVYVCGPGEFIDDVLSLAAQQGFPAQQIHREYFTALEKDNQENHEFEVEIASSGEILRVPADETILNVLEENGHFIPVSCEEGICGSCLTGLVSGEADHRDVFMTDEEKAQMNQITPCCSRAKSAKLVLDL